MSYFLGVEAWNQRIRRDECWLIGDAREAWLAGWDDCQRDRDARNPVEHLAELLQDAKDEQDAMQRRGQSKQYIRSDL